MISFASKATAADRREAKLKQRTRAFRMRALARHDLRLQEKAALRDQARAREERAVT